MTNQNNLHVDLALNTNAGVGITPSSESYSVITSINTLAAGPIQFTVPGNGSSAIVIPVFSAATAVGCFEIRHTDATLSAPDIVLNMKNGNGVSNIFNIHQGGSLIFWNVALTAGATTATDIALWTVVSASAAATQATIFLSYT